MTFRSRSLLLAAVGLWMAQPLPGQEPPPIIVESAPVEMVNQQTDNQKMADAVAKQLGMSTRLAQYEIHVSFQDGMAELSGTVTSEAQRQEALRVARMVPGVVRVMDNLMITAIMPVQASEKVPPPGRINTLPPVNGNGLPAPTPTHGHGFAPPGMPHGAPPAMMPGHGAGMMPGHGAGMMEPVPIYQHGPVSPYDLNPPRMPPHAWPTYAPYNNVSRVAYPNQYPYQAWPFIGPFYPFPKVPLGWRSVKLEWEDGHWWYKKVATQHDWWRIRYW